MSGIEHAIFALAAAINRLADERARTEPGSTEAPEYTMASDRIKAEMHKAQFEPVCMDEAGMPSKFKLRCTICGELGRNARTHQDEMRDSTHHWVEKKVKA